VSQALVNFMVQDGDAGAAGQGFDQVAALTVNEANHRCHAAETLRGSALQKIRLTRVSPAYDILRQVKTLNPKYYDYLFRCGILFTEFKRYSRGIMDMRLRLYFEEFGQILIPFPSASEQSKIVAFLEEESLRIDSLASEATRAIDLLKERRTALISAAVTGKIDVRGLVRSDGEVASKA